MHESAVGVGTHHIDIGAGCEVVRIARTYLQINGHRRGLVNQVVPIAGTLRKRRTIAGVQRCFAAVFYECEFAFKNIDELVLAQVRMAGADWPPGGTRSRFTPKFVSLA